MPDLPDELFLRIFSFLTQEQLQQCLFVSTRFARLVSDVLHYSPELSSKRRFSKFLESKKPLESHSCSRICILNFSRVHVLVRDPVVIELAQNLSVCERLSSLNLNGCNSITDKSLMLLFSHTLNLKEVNLNGCHAITDASIAALAKHAHHLQSLQALECQNITTNGCLSLAEANRSLRLIKFSCAKQLLGAGIVALAQNNLNLESIHLSKCGKITDEHLETISRVLYKLKELVLACNYGRITKDAVVRLLNLRRGALKKLVLIHPLILSNENTWARVQIFSEQEAVELKREYELDEFRQDSDDDDI